MGPLPPHTHGEGYPTRIPSSLPISLTVPHSMYMQESTTKHSLIQVAAILLLCHSTYKRIEDCYKTPIQLTAAKLNTADGSPMMTLGSTVLHL